VIGAGQTILEIVPDNAALIIETHVPTLNITKVRKGQHVNIQLTAFNRRDIPPIEGVVTHVSADQLTHETAAGSSAYYLAYVTVDEASLAESGAYLSPGMPTVCYITTETRTLLRYLMDPLLENFDQALRETS
jgi:multidrug efflux pump subunit AcrA (membrane-fusion protein)